jgi:hypothetical protein
MSIQAYDAIPLMLRGFFMQLGYLVNTNQIALKTETSNIKNVEYNRDLVASFLFRALLPCLTGRVCRFDSLYAAEKTRLNTYVPATEDEMEFFTMILERTGLTPWIYSRVRRTIPKACIKNEGVFCSFLKNVLHELKRIPYQILFSAQALERCEWLASCLRTCLQMSCGENGTTEEWNFVMGEVMADVEEIIDIQLVSITHDAIHYFVEKGWNDSKHILQLEWRDLKMTDCFLKMFDQFND